MNIVCYDKVSSNYAILDEVKEEEGVLKYHITFYDYEKDERTPYWREHHQVEFNIKLFLIEEVKKLIEKWDTKQLFELLNEIKEKNVK